MNAHDLMKAWDNAVVDARTRFTRDEKTNLKHVSGMLLQSSLRVGGKTDTSHTYCQTNACADTYFNCTNRVLTCTWHNC